MFLKKNIFRVCCSVHRALDCWHRGGRSISGRIASGRSDSDHFRDHFRESCRSAEFSLSLATGDWQQLGKATCLMDSMAPAAAAPLFLVPPEEVGVSSTSIDSTTAATEHFGNDFLDVVHRAMPPGGRGAALSHDVEGGGLMGIMGLTENNSATYLTSGNECLDFFFQVVPTTTEHTLVTLLARAWKEDALKALKLMFHLRGVRGTGKADKDRFYYAALWLHEQHPATLCENMGMVAEFGYFKDLLEVLLRLIEGPSLTQIKVCAKARHKAVRQKGKDNAKQWKAMHPEKQKREDSGMSEDSNDRFAPLKKPWQGRIEGGSGYYAGKGAAARAAKKAGTLRPREERVAASREADRAAKEKAAVARKEKLLQFRRKVAEIYFQDPKFQALYLRVAEVFSGRLKEDLKALDDDRLLDISLAAKWAPSPDSSYDRSTLMCYAIATQMFPKEVHPEYEGLSNHKYGFVVIERLRREVLVPLRKVLEIPEVYMSAQKWGEVNYRRVASVAMTNYKTHFLKHDPERFNQFLADVKSGKEKVAAGAVLPHQILKAAVEEEGQAAEVAELQWKRLVEDLKAKGSLSNCIAVCDVSGSMSGEPMDVCIALGMLLSDLSEEPWKGHVVTFSSQPEIHLIKGDSLKDRHKFTQSMNWGMNTDLQLVFDKLLRMARHNKLAPEKMVRRLFIFSDMEFDQASWTPWETDYRAICRKFRAAGYGTPPDVVFWNLRDTTSIPALKSQAGVALVSGFSANLLKVFLEKGGCINPVQIMDTAIEGEEYSKLKVVD